MRSFLFHLFSVVLIASAMMQKNDFVWASLFRLILLNELHTEIKVKLLSTQTMTFHPKDYTEDREISCTIPASGGGASDATNIQILLQDTDLMVTASFGMKLHNIAYTRNDVVVFYSSGGSGDSKTMKIDNKGVQNFKNYSKWLEAASEMKLETESESRMIDGIQTYVFPYNKAAALSSFLSASSSSSVPPILLSNRSLIPQSFQRSNRTILGRARNFVAENSTPLMQV